MIIQNPMTICVVPKSNSYTLSNNLIIYYLMISIPYDSQGLLGDLIRLYSNFEAVKHKASYVIFRHSMYEGKDLST